MLLDEWHLRVHVPSADSHVDVEAVRAILDERLRSFCEQLQAELRSATGLAELDVTVTQ